MAANGIDLLADEETLYPIGFCVVVIVFSMLLPFTQEDDSGRQRVWEGIAAELKGTSVVEEHGDRAVRRIRWSAEGVAYTFSHSCRGVELWGRVPDTRLEPLSLNIKGGFPTRGHAVRWSKDLGGWDPENGIDPREFLTDRVKEALDRIVGLEWTSGLSVGVESDRVLLFKPARSISDVRFREFIHLSQVVLRQALRVCRRTGIVFLPSGPVGPTACQVCGGPLQARVVHCVSCGTAHHRECWEYATRCSTYGCGSTAYRRRVA